MTTSPPTGHCDRAHVSVSVTEAAGGDLAAHRARQGVRVGHRRAAYVLYGISSVILLAGLSSTVWIYRASERQSGGSSLSEGGNSPYELNPDYSKQYLRELELYGGQANVLAYEIRTWFAALWQGTSLAYMVAGLAILVSLGVFYAADQLRSRGRG